MTNSHTLNLIIKEKQRELLKSHKALLTRYLKNISKLNIHTRNQILHYYDTQITKDNIEEHYNKKLRIFLTDLLT